MSCTRRHALEVKACRKKTQRVSITLLAIMACLCIPEIEGRPSLTDGWNLSRLFRRAHCDRKMVDVAQSLSLRNVTDLGAIIATIPKAHPSGTWLQIGANSMNRTAWSEVGFQDPLLEHLQLFDEYRKVFVEPVPSVFRLLEINAKDIPNSIPVNAAVVPDNSTTKTITMYCPMADASTASWVNLVCSMDRAHLDKMVFNTTIVGVDVQALTVRELFQNFEVSHVKVLLIDTEGADGKILKMMPFGSHAFQPELVVFEHLHISQEEREECIALLRQHCYVIHSDQDNTYGIKLTSLYASRSLYFTAAE